MIKKVYFKISFSLFQVSGIMLIHLSKGKYHIFPNWKSVFRISIHNGWLHLFVKETDHNAFSYDLYNNSQLSVKLQFERWPVNWGPLLIQSRLQPWNMWIMLCGWQWKPRFSEQFYITISIFKSAFQCSPFFLPVYHYPDLHNGLHPEEARLPPDF